MVLVASPLGPTRATELILDLSSGKVPKAHIQREGEGRKEWEREKEREEKGRRGKERGRERVRKR